MTEPQPVMEQPEQDQLTRQVGRALLTVAGADWQQVRAEYRSAGRHIEVDVFVTGPDGQVRPVRPPQEVVEGLGKLRQGMYRPGRGTWLSALYVLDPPSSFSAEFEPDAEPRWRRVPPPIGFADELRFFPRADEHIPDWLRQRVGLPPVGGEAAGAGTPPRGNPAQAGVGQAPGSSGQAGGPVPGGNPGQAPAGGQVPGGGPAQGPAGGPVPGGGPGQAPAWVPGGGPAAGVPGGTPPRGMPGGAVPHPTPPPGVPLPQPPQPQQGFQPPQPFGAPAQHGSEPQRPA